MTDDDLIERIKILRDRWAEQSVTLKPTSGTPTQHATDGTLAYCARELTEYVLRDEARL